MYALNFYSPMVADQLRSGRKTATIRLGDKSRKYRKGMIVQVLAGTRFSPRLKIFDAVEKSGALEYYLIEQEVSPPGGQFAMAEKCMANWKKLRP